MTFDDFITIAFVIMGLIYTADTILIKSDISYLQNQMKEIKKQLEEQTNDNNMG